MKLTLPPGVTAATMRAAFADFATVVGAQWVLATDEDRQSYTDHFALDESRHAPAGAVAPASAEEVREIVRIANRHKIPLWPISRGKNFGYGGAAPLLKGSVVLDLSRMKKIEIDVENGTALVEPGVGFYDLHDYLTKNKIPLWISVPGNSWGSVAGNALDRGVGYTSYGDHTSKICGLEVVMPDGDLVRTGMGAMDGAPTWQLYRYGFGPAWDQMFVQSNYGIVTKLGLWLLPEPESVLAIDMELDQADDLGWMVDVLAEFRRDGTLVQAPSIGNWLRAAAVLTKRSDWYDKPGLLPESVITAIRQRFGIGWWSAALRLYGYRDVNRAYGKVITDRINAAGKVEIKTKEWERGTPLPPDPFMGYPITFPLQNANWYGGRAAHVGFSPVLPPKGDLAMAQFKRTHEIYTKYGFDYHASFAMGERHLTNVNQVLFDKDDPAMVKQADAMFIELVRDATEQRYGEYRTHLDYMDLVASTYNFNDHALRRLNEKVKSALDPNGIIAPGKNGIWPAAFEGERS